MARLPRLAPPLTTTKILHNPFAWLRPAIGEV